MSGLDKLVLPSYETRLRKILRTSHVPSRSTRNHSSSPQPPLPSVVLNTREPVPDANVLGMAELKKLVSCVRDLGVDLKLGMQQSVGTGLLESNMKTSFSKWKISLELIEFQRMQLLVSGQEISCTCVKNSNFQNSQSRRGSQMVSRRDSILQNHTGMVSTEKIAEQETQYQQVCEELQTFQRQAEDASQALEQKQLVISSQEARIKELEGLLIIAEKEGKEQQRTIHTMSTQLQKAESEYVQLYQSRASEKRAMVAVDHVPVESTGTYIFDTAVATATSKMTQVHDYSKLNNTGIALLQQPSSSASVVVHQIALGRKGNVAKDMFIQPAKQPALSYADVLMQLSQLSKTATALGTPDVRVLGEDRHVASPDHTDVDIAQLGNSYIFTWQDKVRPGATVVHANTPGVPRLQSMYIPYIMNMTSKQTNDVVSELKPAEFLDAHALTPLPLEIVLHLIYAYIIKTIVSTHPLDYTGMLNISNTSIQAIAIPLPIVWTLVMMVDMVMYQLHAKDDELKKAAECVIEANKANEHVQVQLSRLEQKMELEQKQKEDMQQALVTAKVAQTRMKRVLEQKGIQQQELDG